MIPSIPSSKVSLIRTVPRPGDTLFDVEPPTLVGLFAKSVISLKSLQTCTLAALSISQQSYLGLLSARTFGCQLSLSGVGSVLTTVSCVVESHGVNPSGQNDVCMNGWLTI